MDATTPKVEEGKMEVDDGQDPMAEDMDLKELEAKKEVEDIEEKKQGICVGVLEQKSEEKELLDTALRGQKESSSQLDERKDDDHDIFQRLKLIREVLVRIEEEEDKELRKIQEKIKNVELLEREKKEEKQREKAKPMSQSQNQGRDENLPVLLSQEVDAPLIGEKRTRDHLAGKKRKAQDLNVETSIEPMDLSDAGSLLEVVLKIKETESIEMDDGMKNKSHDGPMDDSDKENGSKVLDKSIKEWWDDSSDDKNTSPESMNKEVVKLRSPVICVLGHVDSGTTTLLDFIRKSHVQDSDVSGITPQIGATMMHQEALREKCKMAEDFSSFDLKLPGLLVINTPGPELLRNLRSSGTSVCDIAILVVDIMRGLETQTVEFINLLRETKTPFVVALNKVDKLYGWKSDKDSDVESTFRSQGLATKDKFYQRCQELIVQFANESLNTALFYENPDPYTFVSMVPTSAISGDGIGNLLCLIAKLTQTMMPKKLIFSEELKATVLEVKSIPGLGTTVDVILVNGWLKEGDTIVMAGREGPVVGQIQSLLTPHPLKEMRLKNQYVEHKTIEGAQGVKITGKDLEKCIAGLPLFVARKPSDVEPLEEKAAALIEQVASSIKTSEIGVYVQASTLGSLESFLENLTSFDISYSAVNVGPVLVKDVMKASAMLEHGRQYATILAFDVKVERLAQLRADAIGVRVIPVDSICQAVEEFFEHMEECLKKKEEALSKVVFPCICKVKTPGKGSFKVIVKQGRLRVGTPLLLRDRYNLELGEVASISAADGSSVDMAGAKDKVMIQMKAATEHIRVIAKDLLNSHVTKESYELCKKYCREEFSVDEWDLMLQLWMASTSFK